MRLLVLLACLALLVAGPASAQLTIDSLEATHRSGTLYHFPLIGGDSAAAVRINTFLQTQELEKLPGQHRESPFEDLWPPGDSHNGLIRMRKSLVRPAIRNRTTVQDGEVSLLLISCNASIATTTARSLRKRFQNACKS